MSSLINDLTFKQISKFLFDAEKVNEKIRDLANKDICSPTVKFSNDLRNEFRNEITKSEKALSEVRIWLKALQENLDK